ncbi:MAG: glycoside hydrolase, partial [Proteobacteria bacterium]
MSARKMKLVLCWHMHQPWYRESQGGNYQLPWVYLHAIKDYVDMAASLEANPAMRAVVNFTPVLLEQIDDYARKLDGWLESGTSMSEPLLDLLGGVEQVPCDADDRARLLRACTRANAHTMIDVHPVYRELLDYTQADGGAPRYELLSYLGPQYFLDLLT